MGAWPSLLVKLRLLHPLQQIAKTACRVLTVPGWRFTRRNLILPTPPTSHKPQATAPVVTIKKRRTIDIKRSANGAVQGFFDPQTGQSFLIADNLSAEAAPGVLMHEVGIHMAADGSMKALFNRAVLMLKAQKADPFMRAVQAKLDAAGETSPEEVSAYLVEAYENQRAQAPASVKRWLADLLATVKA